MPASTYHVTESKKVDDVGLCPYCGANWFRKVGQMRYEVRSLLKPVFVGKWRVAMKCPNCDARFHPSRLFRRPL